jgi:hypothetical protein
MSNFADRSSARLGDPTQALSSYVIGQNARGNWVALEAHGLAGGIFVSRDAALHYAEFETEHRPGAVHLASRSLDLKV